MADKEAVPCQPGVIKIAGTNTGASKLNVNSLGVKIIERHDVMKRKIEFANGKKAYYEVYKGMSAADIACAAAFAIQTNKEIPAIAIAKDDVLIITLARILPLQVDLKISV